MKLFDTDLVTGNCNHFVVESMYQIHSVKNFSLFVYKYIF